MERSAIALTLLFAAGLHQVTSGSGRSTASMSVERRQRHRNPSPEYNVNFDRPYFGRGQTEVIVQEGHHAFFHCAVHNLGNSTVSWVRNADKHILFIGADRFVREDRYELIPSRHGRWTLKLRYVAGADAGKFECQVSTQPKMSKTYSLNVVVPSVKILGDREVHANAGTAVAVRCLISNVLSAPSYVFWHHGDKRLLDERGAVSIVTQRVVGEGAAVSTLTLLNPTPERAGVYTCRPEHLDPAYVRLHIVQVEKPAAIQHEGRGGVAAIASASSASGGHSGNKKKKAKKSAMVSKGKINLSVNGGVGPLHASSLILVATWTMSELCLFLRLR